MVIEKPQPKPLEEEPEELDKESSETSSAEIGGAEKGVSRLTTEAEEFIRSADVGMPFFITENVRRMAAENGVEINDSDTPQDVIQKLKEKGGIEEETTQVESEEEQPAAEWNVSED